MKIILVLISLQQHITVDLIGWNRGLNNAHAPILLHHRTSYTKPLLDQYQVFFSKGGHSRKLLNARRSFHYQQTEKKKKSAEEIGRRNRRQNFRKYHRKMLNT